MCLHFNHSNPEKGEETRKLSTSKPLSIEFYSAHSKKLFNTANWTSQIYTLQSFSSRPGSSRFHDSRKSERDARTVMVGGLSKDTTEDSLRKYFIEKNMYVTDCEIIRYKHTGISRQFGFVEFVTVEQVYDACEPGLTKCNNANVCYSNEMRCDGDQHCPDGDDEANCSDCNNDAVLCALTSECIPKWNLCDGQADCPDKMDEKNCDCKGCSGSGKVLCEGSQKVCIEKSKICDGNNDCSDGEDEEGCPGTCNSISKSDESGNETSRAAINLKAINCDGVNYDWRYGCGGGFTACEGYCKECYTQSAFDCNTSGNSTRCIHRSLVCNGVDDCGNGRDEANCDCSANHMTICSSVTINDEPSCFSSSQRCDGYSDCPTGEDENDCDKCTNNSFYCEKDKRCVPSTSRCDGVSDCSDHADEMNCTCEECHTTLSCFSKADPSKKHCLRGEHLCDGTEHCFDGEDEKVYCNDACEPGLTKCNNANVCYSNEMRCDGDQHCPDGDDEANCSDCNNDAVLCALTSECIPKWNLCDGQADCPDKMDEKNCDCKGCSGSGKVLCEGSQKVCIEKSKICDGNNDCSDGEDEEGCPGTCNSISKSDESGNETSRAAINLKAINCDGVNYDWRYGCGGGFTACEGYCKECYTQSAFDCNTSGNSTRCIHRSLVNRALNSQPHAIDNKVVDVKQADSRRREFTLFIGKLSPKTTDESLQKHFSKYGQLTQCNVKTDRQTGRSRGFGYVAFGSQEELDRALKDQPHVIDGVEVKINYQTSELDLVVDSLPRNISEESLKKLLWDFFSQYGHVRDCSFIKNSAGTTTAFVSLSSKDELDHALDGQPHVIDGVEVKINYLTTELDLQVDSLPRNISEETLKKSLWDLFSRYGQVRNCTFIKNYYSGTTTAFIALSSKDEVSRALNARPHRIDGKLICTHQKGEQFDLIVHGLPKDTTDEDLYEIFSKTGKVVHWGVKRDPKNTTNRPLGYEQSPTTFSNTTTFSKTEIVKSESLVEYIPKVLVCFDIPRGQVKINYLTTELDLVVDSLPRNISEETLKKSTHIQ
ncbi:low-density lipoprotein receptor domain class A domain-containing protein [Ditylenchus destructor]|uniref:Low-density lipoprotein receptor domain class A domain-containing protein n=1 Tax=Ditylenchus destructor TaxID=166010 RepID=A0AAD4R1W0_9BILA|nr:low-density lipoprotein receptor domain class A domain-containing protein [Ditylenchus destructor]